MTNIKNNIFNHQQKVYIWFYIFNPSIAHFSTRNIAGILRAFWPQAKKASCKEPIDYWVLIE